MGQVSAALRQLKGIGQLAWQANSRIVVGLFFMTIVQGAESIALAWLVKLLFDLLAQALQTGAPIDLLRDVVPILSAQGIILIVGKGLASLSGYLERELAREITIAVQSSLFNKLNSFPGLEYFESSKFHDSLEIGLQAAQSSATGIVSKLSSLLRNLITLAGFLLVMFALGPLLALFVFLSALPDLIAQLNFARQNVELSEGQSLPRRRTYFFRHLLSGWEAAKEVRLYQIGDYLLKKLLALMRSMHADQRDLEKAEMKWTLWASALSNIVYILAFLFVVRGAIQGAYSLGDITLYSSAVMSVQGSLAQLTYLFSAIGRDILQFRKYDEILVLQNRITISPQPRPVLALAKGIHINDLAFRYTDDAPWVLQGLNLEIPAGKSLALVGKNGSGKTTLAKLLTRLYDPELGSILWDGENLKDFHPDDLRKRIGVIFQDFMRFDLSARENIGFGNIANIEDMEAIRRAAAKAGIRSVIEGLPKGYETIVSRWLVEEDSGISFSGGEWQKIALARLLFRQADFLILDEPTASLDAEAEHALYEQILSAINQKTTLLISHRFSTVRMADMVALLENGRVTELGSHEELMGLGREYARLYELQAGKYA